jgi:hypothetical protein
MGRKVCLIGTAPASMMLAPYGNKEWDIWTCSPGTVGVPRSDRHFELHRWEPGQPWFSPVYIDWLEKHKEVLLAEPVESVKNGHAFQWQPLVNKYGPYFFTSSLAWMMAQAMEEGYTTIALFGVDMAATTEYEMQRAGVQYFAMLAAAQGIEVGVPPESDVLRPAPLYGICEGSHVWIKQRARNIELNQRMQEAQKLVRENTEAISFLQGALDDQDWNLHSWFGSIDTQGQFFTSAPNVPALMKAEVVKPTPKKRGRPRKR